MMLSRLTCPKALPTIARRASISSINTTFCLQRKFLNAQRPVSKRHVGKKATKTGEKRIQVELSRRFLPTDASIAALRANCGTPPLNGLKYINIEICDEHEDEAPDEEEMDWQLDMAGFDKDRLRAGVYLINDIGMLQDKMHFYRSEVNPEREEIQSKNLVLQYLSDNANEEFSFELESTLRFLGLHTQSEEWRVGDYSIAVDSNEVTWNGIFPGTSGSACLFKTGRLTLSKRVKQCEVNAFLKKEDKNVKRFMEEHNWAFGKLMKDPPTVSFII
jgi:hypothetical protein